MSLQIFPSNPGFKQQLGGVLGNLLGGGLSNAGQGFMDQRTDLADQKILESLGPNASALDLIKATGQLSNRGRQTYSPLFGELLKGQISQGVSNQKAQLQNEEDLKSAKNLSHSLRSNKKYVGTVPFTGGGNPLNLINLPFNRNAIEKRALVDSEGFLYADKVFTKFNKGTISKDKLKVIRDVLAPNSQLNEREYIARIDALDRVMGLKDNASFDSVKKVLKSAGIEIPSEESASSQSASTLNVYDSSGNIVGTIDKNQADQLPPGYEAR